MDVTLFLATKALIVNKEGRVLILRESGAYDDGTNEGAYDVPGGRLTPGEHFEDALRREIREETGLEVSIEAPISVGEWRPVVQGNQWQIVGVFFICRVEGDDIVTLSQDHDAYEWIEPGAHSSYNLVGNLSDVFETYIKR
ncbi:NUDIX domain-containing protein [Candidatus Kaiserbacteria bacterium]|nr:NUDIX domain-containing protein [Candidatus Kaiserbacteria bacterium]